MRSSHWQPSREVDEWTSGVGCWLLAVCRLLWAVGLLGVALGAARDADKLWLASHCLMHDWPLVLLRLFPLPLPLCSNPIAQVLSTRPMASANAARPLAIQSKAQAKPNERPTGFARSETLASQSQVRSRFRMAQDADCRLQAAGCTIRNAGSRVALLSRTERLV